MMSFPKVSIPRLSSPTQMLARHRSGRHGGLIGLMLLALLLVTPTSRATELDPVAVGAFVDGFVISRMLNEGVVGVTVAIVKDGQLIYARGYGHDDLEAKRHVDSGRSLFRPGSISKTFTWTAVMQLHEQGKIDLEADILDYLPNVPLPDTYDKPITMLDLMAHRPGFEESALGHLIGNRPEAVLPLLDYLNTYQPKQVYPPGDVPAYSNYGTGLAGQIVANVSGVPFEDYMDTYILGPLGMTHSTFREPWGSQRPGAMPADLQQNLSKGYVKIGADYEHTDYEFIGHLGPAGALATTAEDMALWMLAHLGDGALPAQKKPASSAAPESENSTDNRVVDPAASGPRILQTATAQLMHSQHRTLDPRLPGMAHGLIESSVHGYRGYGHGGGTVHFLSDMTLIPELGLGVFISTNTSVGGSRLIDGLVRELVTRSFPPGPDYIDLPTTPVDSPADVAGPYILSRRAFSTLEKIALPVIGVQQGKSGELLLGATGGELRQYVAVAPDQYRSVIDAGEQLIFERGADGRVSRVLSSIPIMVGTPAGLLERPDIVYGLLAVGVFVFAGVLLGCWRRGGRDRIDTRAERRATGWVGVMAGLWLLGLILLVAGSLSMSDPRNIFFNFPGPLILASLWLVLAALTVTVIATLTTPSAFGHGTWLIWRKLRHLMVLVVAWAIAGVLWSLNAIGFNYF